MKTLLSWLHDYLPSKPSLEEISQTLTRIGVEVSRTTDLGKGLENVYVATVQSFSKHPQADRLRMVEVDTGAEILQIVCGAQNFKEGDKVCLARVGACLPNGLTIKQSEIRGVASFGMLCSKEELGIANDIEGIWILPPSAPLGMRLSEFLMRDDFLIEVELTPNRGDCLSTLGLAREIAAGLEIPMHTNMAVLGEAGSMLGLNIEAKSACSEFVLVRLKPSGASPETNLKIQSRLQVLGHKSIHPVVDVTNYVMLDRGQPQHAYCASKVKGTITVRFAHSGETLILLDHTKVQLEPEDLIIADESGPIGLAGIMGGQSTCVDEQTQGILLESANFDPAVVRKTAKRLRLQTDASYRFERSVDPEQAISSAFESVQLLKQHAGLSLDAVTLYRGQKSEKKIISLRKEALEKMVGQPVKNAASYLTRLGFEVEGTELGLRVAVPSFRTDVAREIDVIEEVVRLLGLENIASRLPAHLEAALDDAEYGLCEKIRKSVSRQGLMEVANMSFAALLENQKFAGEAGIALLNPIRSDLTHLRASLIPGLIQVLRFNLDRQAGTVSVYELGHVFKGSSLKPVETLSFAALWGGEGQVKDLYHAARPWDFFDAKGTIEAVFESLGLLSALGFESISDVDAFHPGRCARIRFRNQDMGIVGELHPAMLRHYGFKNPVIALECNLAPLLELQSKDKKYKAITTFPKVARDLAFVLKKTVFYADLKKFVQKQSGPILEKVELFDLYEGKGIDPDYRSLALRLEFSSVEKTLEDSDIEPVITKLVTGITKQFGATLRG